MNTPNRNPRLPELSPHERLVAELDGFVGAGMKKEALRLSRRLLKSPRIPGPVFAAALNAVFTLSERVTSWRPLMEAAYNRVPKKEAPACRFWLMSLRNCCHDAAGVLQLMPKKFTGEFALLEVVYCLEASFALNDTATMRKLASKLPRLIPRAEHPMTQGQLLLALTEYYAREGRWRNAINAAAAATNEGTFLRNAVFAMVEIHVGQALLTLQHGFEQIEKFKKEYDPETELMLPGNDGAVLEQARKEFCHLRVVLEKILPPERQREIGMTAPRPDRGEGI